MAINLSALKRGSSKDLLNKLQSKIETSDAKKVYEKDTRIWQPAVDAAGNGQAVIRFLPATDEDNFPYVKLYSHSFQENGKWFIENCASTLDQPCFVCEENSKLWNSGVESDKEIARARKRKLSFYANVLIIKDPANPLNEGEVKIFRFGQKIFDKIKESISPDEMSGEESISPFCLFEGANFVLKISQVAGFRNYDKSKFTSQSELFGGDEDKLRVLLEKLHDIESLKAPKEFKAYEDNKKKYQNVLGLTSGKGGVIVGDPDDEFEQLGKAAPKEVAKSKVETVTTTDDDNDDLAFFKALANS